MRQALFVITVRLTEAIIKILNWVFGLMAAVPINFNALATGLVAWIGCRAMILLDKEQFTYLNETGPNHKASLQQQQIELQLLSAASMVRDNYLETGSWTDQHTEAIQSLSNQLLNECNWDENAIHQYMRSVVESGTDLSYDMGDT